MMKLEIQTKQFAGHLAAAFAVAASRNPREVLKSVLLVCSSDGAELHATDGEISTQIDATDCLATSEPVRKQSLPVLLPPRVLTILKTLASPTATITVSAVSLTICASGSRFTISTADPNEFPFAERRVGGGHYSCNGNALAHAIRCTGYAVDAQAARYALGGVLWDYAAGLTLAATDGRRLAFAAVETSELQPWKVDKATIVPERAMRLISSLAASCESVEIRHAESSLIVYGDRQVLTCRLLEGRFPRWREVVPQHTTVTRCRVGALLQAVRMACVTTGEESRGLEVVFGDGELTLSGEAASVGSSQVQCDCEGNGGITLAIDGAYLRQCLECLPEAEAVEICTATAEDAVAFRLGNVTAVIMPLIQNGGAR